MEKNTITTHFTNLHQTLIEKLSRAIKRIQIAVCWMNDLYLIETILNKAKTVPVEIIVSEDPLIVNLKDAYLSLIGNGANIYVYPSSKLMHHKYCIIDEDFVITGSYNFTYGARQNEENFLVINHVSVVDSFKSNFQELLKKSRLLNYRNSISFIRAELNEALIGIGPIKNMELKKPKQATENLEIFKRQLLSQKIIYNELGLKTDEGTVLISGWDEKTHVKKGITLGKKYVYYEPCQKIKNTFPALWLTTQNVHNSICVWRYNQSFALESIINLWIEWEITANGGFKADIKINGCPLTPCRCSVYDFLY